MIYPSHPYIDLIPVLGNTWKFTACVAAIALCTSMLIVCAIKGPSWYMLFSNYRHRRLRQEENEEGLDQTVFTNARRSLNHALDIQQTCAYKQNNRRVEEEEEEGYIEDPYIKMSDSFVGKGMGYSNTSADV